MLCGIRSALCIRKHPTPSQERCFTHKNRFNDLIPWHRIILCHHGATKAGPTYHLGRLRDWASDSLCCRVWSLLSWLLGDTLGELLSVRHGPFPSFFLFATEFIFELSHDLFQPGYTCSFISMMSPTPDKFALTEVISQSNQHGSLSFGDSNIACNPTGPLHHFKVAHQNIDRVERQKPSWNIWSLPIWNSLV